jgi:hypothetical protein
MKKEKEDLTKSKEQIEKTLKEVNNKSSTQIDSLKAELEESQEKIKSLQIMFTMFVASDMNVSP